jgi:hypothetical protein
MICRRSMVAAGPAWFWAALRDPQRSLRMRRQVRCRALVALALGQRLDAMIVLLLCADVSAPASPDRRAICWSGRPRRRCHRAVYGVVYWA